jgi:hypothetical protein
MENTRVKISSIVESQLPRFVREDYPLVSELLREYYKSLESNGSAYDILQNIDQYVKINNLTNLITSTNLTSDVGFADNVINVSSTEGFPKTYGLISIDNEIILYKSKTSTTFEECVRGFSGVTEYTSPNSEDFIFSSTEIEEHSSINSDGTSKAITNISNLFLLEFFNKSKKQFLYGFEDRDLYSGINQNIFLKQSKDFYSSKGTDRSFEILFRVLYGKDVEVIRPSDYLIKPSDAKYRVTKNVVVESIQGNPENLINQTVFQDQYGDISKSFGTVTDVQKIIKNNKEYYTLMLDYDFNKDVNVSGSIFGDLKIHPKTNILDEIPTNSTSIIVDSTIGFPKNGELTVTSGGVTYAIQYNGTTVNQFLNCSGVNGVLDRGLEIYLNTYAYGYSNKSSGNTGEQIRFRITGVLSKAEPPKDVVYYDKNDIGKVVSLGYSKNEDSVLDNRWVFNKTVKCEVSNFIDEGGFKYTIETFDDNGIYEGDSVEIDYINKSTGKRETFVIDGFNVKTPIGSIPQKRFQIQTNGFEISKFFTVKKLISKFSNNFAADVLNVYKDFDSNDLYVTSSSLPFYAQNLNSEFKDLKVVLNGSFSNETLKIVNDGDSHGFITGDAIVYSRLDSSTDSNSLGIQTGVYFVKKIDDARIKIARSRSNIDSEKFISIASTTLTNSANFFNPLIFSKVNNTPSTIDSQRCIKLLKTPESNEKQYETKIGTTGILVNGVEISNYKSKDVVYYGPIENIDVIAPGKGYDVINPPKLEISLPNNTSIGASGYCWVEGSLEKVDLIDGGFDYIDEPVITVSGGSGEGAVISPNTVDYEYYVDFNSSSSNERINLTTNTIGFSTYHKFKTGESIIYLADDSGKIGGLTTEAKYFAKVIDDYAIRLHETYSDSLTGINTVNITSFGVGNHRFRSSFKKKKITSLVVLDSGSGYKNKKISVSYSGINTANNTVNVYKHPYSSGETIYYYGGDTNISGLDTGKYIVTKINDTSFKLSNIGIGSTAVDFYYQTNQYVDFKSNGSGDHIFNYEPIQINITGQVGSYTTTGLSFSAKVQPFFGGKIDSVFVNEGGTEYGSPDIINFNKQPDYSLNSGSGAIVSPIISNGKIVSVTIKEKGEGYNSPPNLVIRGFGLGAILSPVISNGKLIEVKVLSGGINYEQKNTFVDVVSSGSGCQLFFTPKIWSINKVKKLIETKKISSDDSVIYEGNNKIYGLQYTHSYSPRSLRKKVYSQNFDSVQKKYRSDYENDLSSNKEKYHSPLLGWAYDGNPIYGPYGYDSPENKKVRQILSGYSDPIDNQNYRPDKNIFPAGYFVEDFVFNNSGDLDENNGRFCVTPEFPNGTYAYFMTLSESSAEETGGIFAGEKEPKFPYIIGKNYKSTPIDFNFDSKINQENFDFYAKNILRNTNSYNVDSEKSSYEYFLNSNDFLTQTIRVKNTSKGKIDFVKIISEGENYKVNDKLIFDNSETGGFSANAVVSFIGGKTITGISHTSTKIYDIELYPTSIPNKIVGFSSSPHNLVSGDQIYLNSLSEYDPALQKSFKIGVSSERFTLNTSIGNTSVTGIITYFNISNITDDNIKENDILSIGSEEIKILSVDKKSSRVKVLRSQNSTVSSAHTAYSFLYEKPRKFYLDLTKQLKNKNYNLNREIYFNPVESLGIGTNIGFGHTIVFSNPGSGITSIIVPEKTIYIENHNLETGDELIYKTNGGAPITVSNSGISTFSLSNNSKVYAARISNNFVGISTIKVGIGTSGEFVGISQTGSTLFFVNSGSGENHSFVTNFDNVSKANLTKTTITVSLASTHSLQVNDIVDVEVFPKTTKTIEILYNDFHRRLVVDPKDFSTIDVLNNLIPIQNHGFVNGQKLIHVSSSPAQGLENQEIYYAIVYDSDRIRLSKSYFGAVSQNKSVVGISSTSFGTLYQINPKINAERNQKVIFDLSDSSLSQQSSGIGKTSSFEFEIYLDKDFSTQYYPINSDGTSKIVRSGSIGIDSSAKLEFQIDSDFPDNLFYKLTPITSLSVKNEILVDDEVDSNNKLSFVISELNGNKIITGIASTSFTFINENELYFSSYSTSDSTFKYNTNSKTESGNIKSIQIKSSGNSYQRLPSISSITSSNGSGAIILPQSNTIGEIIVSEIEDIGFNYSADPTIRPLVKYPTILRVEPLSSIKSVEVTSYGKDYTLPPDFVVIDAVTNEVVKNIILRYNSKNNFLDIIQNDNLYGVTPKIIPTNNSNGVGISSISFNNTTKVVSVVLNKQFSDPNDFPFSIGDNVLIEGISILSSSDKGYNSKNYNYSTFPVVGVNTSSGGSNASIDYYLGDYLTLSEVPGIFDSENSSGKVIQESSFPKFNILLEKNSFVIGENVEFENISGKVLKWDSKNEYLTVETTKDFTVNSLIYGKASKSQAFVKEVLVNESFCSVDSSSIVKSGWKSDTGFLNDNLQRVQDSDYYQYLSYSLKSEVPLDEWNDIVSNLNHTLGFKKFSDLILKSSPENFSGLSTSQNNGLFSALSEVNSIVDIDCIQDYDLVSENNFYVENNLTSDEIVFNSVIIQDYSESIGNLALEIDDISEDFNTTVSKTFITSFNI